MLIKSKYSVRLLDKQFKQQQRLMRVFCSKTCASQDKLSRFVKRHAFNTFINIFTNAGRIERIFSTFIVFNVVPKFKIDQFSLFFLLIFVVVLIYKFKNQNSMYPVRSFILQKNKKLLKCDHCMTRGSFSRKPSFKQLSLIILLCTTNTKYTKDSVDEFTNCLHFAPY